MTHETATEIEASTDALRVPPHAKAFAERTRKIEAVPLGELAQRVAHGLARLRADFGLEPRATDALGALFAALPDTEVVRRGSEMERAHDERSAFREREFSDREGALERELADAVANALERDRAAADVERRSESLKEALRERSADLAAALARAEAGDAARRDLEALHARAAESAATLEQLRGENRELAAAFTRAADAHVAELAQASAEGEEGARLEREVAALASELRTLRREVEDAQDARRVAQEAMRAAQEVAHVAQEATQVALAESDSRSVAHAAEREVSTAERAASTAERAASTAERAASTAERAAGTADRAAGTARLLDAAEARLRAVRDVLESDRSVWIAREASRAEEVRHLARERDGLVAEIAVVRTNAQRVDRSRQEALDDAQRVLGEMREKLAEKECELTWRTREMDALRDSSGGVRWKLLGGDALQRIARWSDRERKGGST